jgi:hypothetical protein
MVVYIIPCGPSQKSISWLLDICYTVLSHVVTYSLVVSLLCWLILYLYMQVSPLPVLMYQFIKAFVVQSFQSIVYDTQWDVSIKVVPDHHFMTVGFLSPSSYSGHLICW